MARYRFVMALLFVCASSAVFGAVTTQSSSGSSDHVATPAASAAPAVLPSMEDVKGMMAEQKYKESLASLVKIVGLQGPAAAAYNRHQVLMLLADCRLHCKQVSMAMDVLNQAQSEATQAHNWPDSAEAQALNGAIHLAPTLTYTPNIGDDRKPLNLLDTGDRGTAYKRIYDEKMGECKAQEVDSKSGESLTPLLKLGPTFALLRALDQVNNHSTKKSDDLGLELANWSAGLIDKVLDGYSSVCDRIVRDSNVTVNGRGHRGKAGLSADEKNDLINIRNNCKEVPDAITKLAATFTAPTAKRADDNRAHAVRLLDRVTQLMAADARIVINRK